MSDIALFHSALGVRGGITDADARFRAAGHRVTVVDQYDGRTFDDYDAATAYVEGIGFPALMVSALEGVAALPDGFIAAGFSNGGGMAEWVAAQRPVAGALLFSGALPLELLGVPAWPRGVPVQLHHAEDDPHRTPGWSEALVTSIIEAGAAVETFTYAGNGHLFTDPSLPDEYDADHTELLFARALAFLERV